MHINEHEKQFYNQGFLIKRQMDQILIWKGAKFILGEARRKIRLPCGSLDATVPKISRFECFFNLYSYSFCDISSRPMYVFSHCTNSSLFHLVSCQF